MRGRALGVGCGVRSLSLSLSLRRARARSGFGAKCGPRRRRSRRRASGRRVQLCETVMQEAKSIARAEVVSSEDGGGGGGGAEVPGGSIPTRLTCAVAVYCLERLCATHADPRAASGLIRDLARCAYVNFGALEAAAAGARLAICLPVAALAASYAYPNAAVCVDMPSRGRARCELRISECGRVCGWISDPNAAATAGGAEHSRGDRALLLFQHGQLYYHAAFHLQVRARAWGYAFPYTVMCISECARAHGGAH